MKKLKVLLLVLGFIGALAAGCGSSAKTAGPAAPGDNPPPYAGGPRLYMPQRALDAGKIPLNKVVNVRLEVRNIGDQPLVVMPPEAEAVEGC